MTIVRNDAADSFVQRPPPGIRFYLLHGIDEGLMFGFPVTCANGSYEIVQGLELNDFSKARLDVTVNELKDERKTVKQLDLI